MKYYNIINRRHIITITAWAIQFARFIIITTLKARE